MEWDANSAAKAPPHLRREIRTKTVPIYGPDGVFFSFELIPLDLDIPKRAKDVIYAFLCDNSTLRLLDHLRVRWLGLVPI